MIRHIFKIIWNERRTNSWVFIGYILTFCVLWFCCNYISSVLRTYEAKPGFDISRVYMIQMRKKPGVQKDMDDYGAALTFLDRVKRHPDVEYVAMGKGFPYGFYMSGGSMYVNDIDSIRHAVNKANVTSDFFDVYRIPLTSGKVFDWQDEGDKNKAVITAFKNDFFGSDPNNPAIELVPISQIQTLTEQQRYDDIVVDVIGTTGRIINAHTRSGLHMSTVFLPLSRQEASLSQCDIVLRVKQDTRKDFPQKFRKDMEEQLSIGPYFLSLVKPTKEIKEERSKTIIGKMNSAYAVTFFLIINIFLGILGTFWFRAQSRRSEIGLRLAIGSSKSSIRKMFISETLFLLSLASIIGIVICLNLFGKDLLNALDIPTINREAWRIGWEQDVINFALTFGFLAIVSVLAVLYPANQAAKIQPAETLQTE